jgi:hypothetical protein
MSMRLAPHVEIITGLAGNYPNLIFDNSVEDVAELTYLLESEPASRRARQVAASTRNSVPMRTGPRS